MSSDEIQHLLFAVYLQLSTEMTLKDKKLRRSLMKQHLHTTGKKKLKWLDFQAVCLFKKSASRKKWESGKRN